MNDYELFKCTYNNLLVPIIINRLDKSYNCQNILDDYMKLNDDNKDVISALYDNLGLDNLMKLIDIVIRDDFLIKDGLFPYLVITKSHNDNVEKAIRYSKYYREMANFNDCQINILLNIMNPSYKYRIMSNKYSYINAIANIPCNESHDSQYLKNLSDVLVLLLNRNDNCENMDKIMTNAELTNNIMIDLISSYKEYNADITDMDSDRLSTYNRIFHKMIQYHNPDDITMSTAMQSSLYDILCRILHTPFERIKKTIRFNQGWRRTYSEENRFRILELLRCYMYITVNNLIDTDEQLAYWFAKAMIIIKKSNDKFICSLEDIIYHNVDYYENMSSNKINTLIQLIHDDYPEEFIIEYLTI